MSGPALTMNLEAIRHNTRAVIEAGAKRGVDIVAVTKAAHGDPAVAHALSESGAKMLGESRLSNIRRLRRGGTTTPVMMLRIPSLSETADIVSLCDMSLNSEVKVLRSLARDAEKQQRVHRVVIMLEMGDRREGVNLSEAAQVYEAVLQENWLHLSGIGANFMCATGVFPTIEKLQKLVHEATRIEREYDISLEIISGGNSTSIPLLDDPDFPDRVNQLRVGAALFLGEPMLNAPSSIRLRADAFTLSGELVELKHKPSVPEGEIGPDAFGNKVVYEDRGFRLRGIVNLGRVDMHLAGLTPRDRRIEITTASSDHLILDLTEAGPYEMGDEVVFDLDYPALLQASLSPSIEKRLLGVEPPRYDGVHLLASNALNRSREISRFKSDLQAFGLGLETGTSSDAHKLRVAFADDGPSTIRDLMRITGAHGLLVLDSEADLVLSAEVCNAAILGMRNASEEQAAHLRQRDISVATIEAVDGLGLAEALRRLLYELQVHGNDFILAIDTSVTWALGPDEKREGLTHREFSTAMELIAASKALRGVVLTGFKATETGHIGAILNYLMSLVGRRVMDGIPTAETAKL